MAKVSVNPKQLISEHYDSLINKIDIHTEELLEKFGAESLLKKHANDMGMLSAFFDEKSDLLEFGEKRLTSLVEFHPLMKAHSSRYKIDSSQPSQKFEPGVTKTREYLNATRDAMNKQLEVARAETFATYEKIKDELKPEECSEDNREQAIDEIKRRLFDRKFPCLFHVDRIHVSNIRDIDVDNPSPFRLNLLFLDFYLDRQDLVLLK